jgi:5-carboxymethyl-2-hydroxymuconate isomerase
MPQITLEYTNNITEADMKIISKDIHNILAEKLPTKIENCKTRIIKIDNYIIGDDSQNNGFICLSIKVLKGRTKEILEDAAKNIAIKMNQHLANYSVDISVAIEELPDIYIKI